MFWEREERTRERGGGKGTASRKKAPAPLKDLARTTKAGYIRPLGWKFWPAPDISGLGPEISGLGRKFRPGARKYLDYHPPTSQQHENEGHEWGKSRVFR